MSGLVFAFSFIFFQGLKPFSESDLWWHLRAGEWILNHHSFPTTDIFSSIEPERTWKTFNWLFEVVTYQVYQLSGYVGLRVMVATIATLGFIQWFRYFILETKNDIIALILLLILLILFSGRIQPRPHLVNIFFEASILIFLHSGGKLETWSKRAGFFILGVIWTNFHTPCAAVGAGVIGFSCLWKILLGYQSKDNVAQKIRDYAWPIGLAAVAVICNPYGPSLLLSGISNIAPVYMGINEWQSPLSLPTRSSPLIDIVCVLTPLTTFILITLTIITKIRSKTLHEKRNVEWLSMAGGPLAFLAISQVSMRFVYLSTASLAWMLGNFHFQKQYRKLLSILAVALSIVAIWYYSSIQGGIPNAIRNLSVDVRTGLNPAVAVELIQEGNLQGKIYTPAAWGGYVLWFANPIHGVSNDGRNNLSSTNLHIHDLIETNTGRDGSIVAENLGKLGVDLAILPAGAFPFSHWPDKWIRVAHDINTEVFLKTESADMNRVKNIVGASANATPLEVQEAAKHFFGERYYRTNLSKIEKLKTEHSEKAIHELAVIEWVAGHENVAIQTLANHLQESPTCLRAAVEIAEILHEQGRIKEAMNLLSPLENAPNIPTLARIFYNHLQEDYKKIKPAKNNPATE